MDGGGKRGCYESSEHGDGERQFHDEVVRLVASIECLAEEGQEDEFQWQSVHTFYMTLISIRIEMMPLSRII